MRTENRRAFLINFAYFFIWVAVVYMLLQFGLPLLSPFVLGFVFAYFLQRPIRFFSCRLKCSRRLVSIVVVSIFYLVIGSLLTLVGVKASSGISDLLKQLPLIYAQRIEPALVDLFDNMEVYFLQLDEAVFAAMRSVEERLVQSLGSMVSEFSISAMGMVSSVATALPGQFIELVLTVISTFFISADYDRLTGFCANQLSQKARSVVHQVRVYAVETLFVCVRSYILIMFITFVELLIGFVVLRIEHALLLAVLISVFDILPVLGVGGILLPWVVLAVVQGNFSRGIGLLLLYFVILIMRNILEPKIVGGQLGLHPVVTLASMFVGVQLLGVVGLFGFPIVLSLLRHLNDTGTITIFKLSPDAAPGDGN